ncbi:MAG: hypothetical protein PVG39_06450 [Desulfobacteraceae bacterium]
MNGISKNRKKIIGSLVLLSIIAAIYMFNDATRFQKVKFSGLQSKAKRENPNPLSNNNVVLTTIHMGTGNGNSLGLVLASPYNNSKQQSQLYKYATKIKSDFILNVGEEKLQEWAKKKNFRDIRATFRGIVNKYLDEPVKEVYLSSFFYE